jgi:hypothetical protein
LEKNGILSACCLIVAYAAVAACAFAAVGAYAPAVVDEVSALFATRHFFFFLHPFASALSYYKVVVN